MLFERRIETTHANFIFTLISSLHVTGGFDTATEEKSLARHKDSRRLLNHRVYFFST